MTDAVQFTEPFARSVLDAMSAHVAILNKKGLILQTNAAWKKFATDNSIRMRPDTVSINYLDVCSASDGGGSVYQGIRKLIDHEIDEFVMEYPCHSPDEKRWFYMRATRLVHGDELLIVISHENITPLKLVEEELQQQRQALKNRERDLERQAETLKDTNTALKVLLDQREKDKTELEERLVSNIRELVFPYLEKLADSRLNERQAAWTDIIRTYLDDVISPFLKRLSSLQMQLTPHEIHVAALVKEGRTTKDIAEIIGSSTDAIEFHRKNIRKKLGLTGSKINLRSYLISLS